MAVSLYFGLPGCGKTSLLVQTAVSEAYKIKMGSSAYSCVITNVPINCEGVYYCNDFNWLSEHYVLGALILIDEATISFDSREYKVFAKGLVRSFVLHRHTKNDIVLFAQIWNRVDKTIRDICDRVYYLHKGVIFRQITYCNHIPYSILFPDPQNNSYGDILMGYRKCSFLSRVFSKRLYRKFVYGYYDTYWIPEDLTPLPNGILMQHSDVSGHYIPPSTLDHIISIGCRLFRLENAAAPDQSEDE